MYNNKINKSEQVSTKYPLYCYIGIEINTNRKTLRIFPNLGFHQVNIKEMTAYNFCDKRILQ